MQTLGPKSLAKVYSFLEFYEFKTQRNRLVDIIKYLSILTPARSESI